VEESHQISAKEHNISVCPPHTQNLSPVVSTLSALDTTPTNPSFLPSEQKHEDPGAAKPFQCPFKRCKRSFTRHNKLKEHIAILRSRNGDENHDPEDRTNWSKFDKDPSHTRPRNLN
jgi:hypothetical protein